MKVLESIIKVHLLKVCAKLDGNVLKFRRSRADE